MERWRWLPRVFEDRYVAINVPDQSLNYVHDGDVALSSKVVVGRKAYPTPITRTAITAVVANPPWNIPGFIAARDLLPKLRRDPNYLATRNMVIMGAPEDDPHGRKIDWHKIEAATFPYAIRQLPGPFTALGQVMLDSPNDFDVYLHDTPNKKLFDLDDREVSNGCVRVQKIFPLASLALTGDAEEGMEKLTSLTKAQMHETQRLELEKPLPVYFLYWTAFSGPDGELEFRPDVYDRDPVLIAALAPVSRAIPLPKTKPPLSAAASGPEEEDLSP
jgi:murein L,D-transpeptidase YcbB/YkuD